MRKCLAAFGLLAATTLALSSGNFPPRQQIEQQKAEEPKPLEPAAPYRGQSNLPPWFKEVDTDRDGQISPFEWKAVAKNLDRFHELDYNRDGFITADEVLRFLAIPTELKFDKNLATAESFLDASDEKYRGTKQAKLFSVRLERGKSYQFDYLSKFFDAYLYLTDDEGNVLAEDDDSGGGLNSRILYQAERTATYRLICASLGKFRPGGFTLEARLDYSYGGVSSKSLPQWFKDLDADNDGQVSLFECRAAGKSLEEARKFDLNGDGFITAEEVVRHINTPADLQLKSGRAKFDDTFETPELRYRSKKAYKIYNVRFEQGKTYQIDCLSQIFYAYLYLEDPDGEIVERDNSGGRGKNARIVHRAASSGRYRIVATSQDGYKTGAFNFSCRTLHGLRGYLPRDLPNWFNEINHDADDQIALYEWRQSGRKLEQFRELDLNDDGFLTPDEIVPHVRKPHELKFQNNRIHYSGVIEEQADDRYKGKKSFKMLGVRLQSGRSFMIEQISNVMQSFLYLEDPEGNIVREHSSPNIGGLSRVVYRAQKAGLHRIVATSLGGFRTGPFLFTIRQTQSELSARLPKELAWFNDLDKDGDGQIGFYEWRLGGKDIDEFRVFDLNDDGFITEEEIVRYINKFPELQKLLTPPDERRLP